MQRRTRPKSSCGCHRADRPPCRTPRSTSPAIDSCSATSDLNRVCWSCPSAVSLISRTTILGSTMCFLYRGKRFYLGLYQAGAQRSVRFDRIGPSYLFCNIHPEMTGVVLAVDSSLYAISDKSGRYIINGVAPGKYTMHVWYENAKPESLASLQRAVVVDGTQRALPTVSVPVVKQIQKEHKNKYGQDYDPDAMNPDY